MSEGRTPASPGVRLACPQGGAGAFRAHAHGSSDTGLASRLPRRTLGLEGGVPQAPHGAQACGGL